jgi:hypothetical protein
MYFKKLIKPDIYLDHTSCEIYFPVKTVCQRTYLFACDLAVKDTSMNQCLIASFYMATLLYEAILNSLKHRV